MDLRICIDVVDMPRAIAFYADGLGLKIGRRLQDEWVEILGAGSPIDLLLNAAGKQPVNGHGAVRSYQRHWTPVHLNLWLMTLMRLWPGCWHTAPCERCLWPSALMAASPVWSTRSATGWICWNLGAVATMKCCSQHSKAPLQDQSGATRLIAARIRFTWAKGRFDP